MTTVIGQCVNIPTYFSFLTRLKDFNTFKTSFESVWVTQSSIAYSGMHFHILVCR